jgi:CRP/FNR family transcriptional regulator, anaerobic regulatory protein
MEELFIQLNGIRRLSAGLENRLRVILTKKHFKKGEIILEQGKVSKDIYFIKTGLIRGFEWKKNQEVTTWLMKEGDIIFSPESFMEQVPSDESIVALEDCEVWGITYDQLESIYDEFPEFNRHGRIITGKYYIHNKKLNSFLTRYTAKEKYLILLQNEPDLIKRVPLKYLASYLDVTPETLSAIRAQISNGD